MPIDVIKTSQNIVSPDFNDELTYDPPKPRRFFTDNVIGRVLSYGLLFDGTLFRLARCSSAGYQKVVTTATVFETNDTKQGNAPNSYGTALAFDSIAQRVDIWIYDYPVLIKRTKDGVTYQDEIEIPANSTYSFDGSTHSVNIVNKVSGQVARYQIVGWW